MMRIASVVVTFAALANVGYSADARMENCTADLAVINRGDELLDAADNTASTQAATKCVAGKAVIDDTNTATLDAGDGGAVAAAWVGACCKDCPAGEWKAADVDHTTVGDCTAYDPCPAGKYVQAAGTAQAEPTCTVCAAGTHRATVDNGQEVTACTNCAAGTYVAETGSTSADACKACDAGTFSTAGSASCDTCQALTEDCPVGKGLTCEAGGDGSDSTCTACADGFYSDVVDKTSVCKASSAVKIATGLTSLLAVLLLLF